MTVLLADDSLLILERLHQAIARHSEITIIGSFSNGTDTLNAIRSQKPNLAIIDIKMPGLTGLEVLQKSKEEELDTRFIILTFYSSKYFREMAIEAGAEYFFSKADDFELMTQVVEEMVAQEAVQSFVRSDPGK